MVSSHLSAERAFYKVIICTATAGVALLTRQKCPKATWGKPQDPDAPERPPGKPKGGFPERRLNGAYKVPQAHLPPPNLPRFGGGERPPFFCKPPAPLTITMGQRLAVFASPNTPRALLSVSNRPPIRAPFPPRERGWGERADALRLPWERFCAQYGLILDCRQKSIRIQHSQRPGSWGSAPSVFCLLLYEQK